MVMAVYCREQISERVVKCDGKSTPVPASPPVSTPAFASAVVVPKWYSYGCAVVVVSGPVAVLSGPVVVLRGRAASGRR